MRSTYSVARVLTLALALLSFFPLTGVAQDADQPTNAPAHLSFVDGSATLEREGQTETAVSGMPFVPGDRLQTTRGRVEVLFADGSALAVDEFTTIELQDRALLRMGTGRLLLTVSGVNDPANAIRYQIDTPSASASTDGPGEYRIRLLNGHGELETELAVFRGYATLVTDVGSTAVRAGERSLARDTLAPSRPLIFNSARFDAFDRWASARRDARLGTASSQYLPRDLHVYSSTFDSHGTWGSYGNYGHVWYPTVAPGWRPYYYGYWSPVPAYGWTWIGYDPWGWPTHHYGRWGFGGGRWFWAPGRTWGGAWVSWASAPGYVGWCPMGYCGGAGFSFGVSFGGPWNGWVVVSNPYFGHGYRYPVHHHAVPPTAIPYRTSFAVHSRAPIAPPVAAARPLAVPRASAGDSQVRASARSAPGRQPLTVPGATRTITPNQPELGVRAVQRSQSPAAQAGAPAGARYVPDGRTRVGPSRQASPGVAPSNQGTASPRRYPPVATTPQTPGITAPSPGYRSGPIQRAQPSTTAPPNPAVVPWRAQPRAPAGAPPVAAFQPATRAIEEAPRGSLSAPPAAGQAQRAPTAMPRSAAPPSAAPQAAPARPASGGAPAGARSPRSR